MALSWSVFVIVCAASHAVCAHVLLVNPHGRVARDADEVPSSEPTQKGRPDMTSLHVESAILYRYAKTSFASRLANKDDEAQEISFTAVLPQSAFISAFHIEMDGKVYQAYVKEKEEAHREYTEAVSQGRTAAKVDLSARDSNRFTVSVNVEPRSKVVFNLTYEELLTRRLGVYDHVINLDPGQIVPDVSVIVRIDESNSISTIRVTTLRVTNEIDSSDDVSNDPLASIDRPAPNQAIIRWKPTVAEQKELRAEGIKGQFNVEYDVDRTASPSQILVSEGYFVHFYSPAELVPLKKHVVFVLDISGSMFYTKLHQLKEAMATILRKLQNGDFFSIILFSNEVGIWLPSKNGTVDLSLRSEIEPSAEVVVPVTPDTILLAKDFISGLSTAGATNINDALISSLEIVRIGRKVLKPHTNKANTPSRQTPVPMIVFLTDGQPNVGQSDPSAIISGVTQKNKRKTPIFSLAFGNDADKDFLKKLSLKNNAFSRLIYEASDAALQLRDFYRQIASPLLANVTFNYEPTQVVNDSLTELHFNTLFQGGELVVAGRLEPSTDKLRGVLMARAATGKARYGFPASVTCALPEVRDTTAPSFMEKLWAYLNIQQLMDKHQQEDGVNSTSKARALELALKYSFVTPLTSLVVVKPNETSRVDTEDAAKPSFDSSGGRHHPGLWFAPRGHLQGATGPAGYSLSSGGNYGGIHLGTSVNSYLGSSGAGYAGSSGVSYPGSSGVGYSSSSGAGYPGSSGVGYPGSSGVGYPGSSGAGYPGSSGAGYPGSSGAGYTGSSGAGYPGSSGAGYTGSSGAGYPGSSGAGYPGSSGVSYPGSSGAGYPGSSGVSYPGSIGVGYPGSSGAGYPGSSGVGYPGSSGVGYPGSSGAGYPGSSGVGYPGSSGVGYSSSSGAGYPGSSGVGYPGSSGVGYPGSSGLGYSGSSGVSYPGSSGVGYSGSSGVGYPGSSGTGYLGASGVGHPGSSGSSYSSTSGVGYPGSSSVGYPGSSGAGYPAASGVSYSGSSGAGYPGSSGTGYPGSSGVGYSGTSGVGYPGSSGVGYPGSSGSSYSSTSGVGYPGSSGTGFLGASGVGHPGSSGSSYSSTSGVGYPGSSGSSYPGTSGVGYPGTSGVGYPGTSGVGYAGSSGMSYPGTSGVGHPDTRGSRYYSTSGGDYLGPSVVGYPGSSGAGYPAASGVGYPGASGVGHPGSSGSSYSSTSGVGYPGTSGVGYPGTRGSSYSSTSGGDYLGPSVVGYPGTSGGGHPGTSGGDYLGPSVVGYPGTSGGGHPGTSGGDYLGPSVVGYPGTSGGGHPGTSGGDYLGPSVVGYPGTSGVGHPGTRGSSYSSTSGGGYPGTSGVVHPGSRGGVDGSSLPTHIDPSPAGPAIGVTTPPPRGITAVRSLPLSDLAWPAYSYNLTHLTALRSGALTIVRVGVNEPDFSFGSCFVVTGPNTLAIQGTCRHLRYCVMPDFKDNFHLYATSYSCEINWPHQPTCFPDLHH